MSNHHFQMRTTISMILIRYAAVMLYIEGTEVDQLWRSRSPGSRRRFVTSRLGRLTTLTSRPTNTSALIIQPRFLLHNGEYQTRRQPSLLPCHSNCVATTGQTANRTLSPIQLRSLGISRYLTLVHNSEHSNIQTSGLTGKTGS